MLQNLFGLGEENKTILKSGFWCKVKTAQIWSQSPKAPVQAWGSALGLKELCPLPGKQVQLSTLELHFDISLNVLYNKYNWGGNQSKTKQGKQDEQSPTKQNYSSSNN